MVKINHNRDELRYKDEVKRKQAEDCRLVKELKRQTAQERYMPDPARSRSANGVAVLKQIVDAEFFLLKHGDWSALRDLIASLEPRDGDLVIDIVHSSMNGIRLQRSSTHPSGLRVDASKPAFTKKFDEIKKLRGKGFRSRSVLKIIGRNRP